MSHAVAYGAQLSAVCVAHDGEELLTADVSAAARKDAGADGGWTMARQQSTKSIPAAIALARVVHVASAPVNTDWFIY